MRTDKWELEPCADTKLALSSTVIAFRAYVRALTGVIYVNWDNLGSLLQKQQVPQVEKLMHRTAQNLTPKYAAYFEKRFPKFPSYYRRSAIAFCLGQVSSFVTRYAQWQSGIRKHRQAKPPRLNAEAGVYPALYKGQCIKYHADSVEIKVFHCNDWIWVEVPLGKQGKRHGLETHTQCSPSLIVNHRSIHLSVPFEVKPDKQYGNKDVVVSVDLGINTTATVTVVNSSGTVIHREFIHPGRDSATCTGRFSMGSLLPWKFHIFHPHVKGSTESGHDRVGNETVGMQTTKVAETSSLSWSGARGESPMVNASELSNKLRDPGKSQIRLIGSSQKACGWDLQLVSL